MAAVCALLDKGLLTRPRRRDPNSHGSRNSSMTCSIRRDGSGGQKGGAAPSPRADRRRNCLASS